MYNDGPTSRSVNRMRRNAGNCSRDANMRKMTRGVVSNADWYAERMSLSRREVLEEGIHIPWNRTKSLNVSVMRRTSAAR